MIFDLRKFAFELGLSQGEIGDVLGVRQPVVSQMANGNRKFRMEHLAALRAKYGDVVDSYIVDEEVAKFFNNPTSQQVTATIIPVGVIEDIKEELKEEKEVVPIEQPPFVPDSVIRKPEVNVLEWAENTEDEHIQNAFNIAKIFRSTRFFIQMNNSAMSPMLHQYEYVFLAPFAEGSKIIDGEVYGIETRAWGILIRHLYDNGDSILACPENTLKFGNIEIPKNSIRNLYHIKFHGSTHLSPSTNNEAERTKRISMQGEQINSLINELGKAGSRNDKLIAILEKKL